MFTRTPILIIVLIALAVCSSIADIPRLLTYQGRLTDDVGDPIADAKYDVDFTIYDDSTSGTGLWTETQTVYVEDGLFNVHLGFAKALPKSVFADHPDVFLAMAIDSGPEMAPRIRLTSSAFAYHALSVADSSVELGDLAQSGAADGDGIRYKTGVGWITETYGGGDINGVTAGNGLIGGGTTGTVALAVGEGTGIDVSTDEVALNVTYTDERYVNATGDGMTGPLVFDYGSDALMDAMIDPENRAIKIYDAGLLLGQLQRGSTNPYGRLDLYSHTPDHQGQKAAIYGSWWGEMELYDEDGDEAVILSANNDEGGFVKLKQEDGADGFHLYGGSTADGSRMYMYNAGGVLKGKIDTDATGNSATILPGESVCTDEMYNEPGMAYSVNYTDKVLNDVAMQDLDSVTITIPTAGHIIVQGSCYGTTKGTLEENWGIIQIDETAGGVWNGFHCYWFGLGSHASATETNAFPINVSRIYYKVAGTYQFRMEGMASVSNGSGAETETFQHKIWVTFHPTSYGPTSSYVSASEIGGFENASPEVVSITNPDGTEATETMYRVDFRELELKAAKARAEAAEAQLAAEQAERELLEAQQLEAVKEQRLNE